MPTYIDRRRIFQDLITELDIPVYHYERAKDRARSLENWLLRDSSSVKQLKPEVYPQGSFRYGTVIRPIDDDGYYDLDLVVTFELSKSVATQKQIKDLLGGEIEAYATAKQFKEKPSEKYRCWRLNYADEVSFHMDVLPSLPNGNELKLEHTRMSVPIDLAQHEISITDMRHPSYTSICDNWFSSNPRGYAKWFEAIARGYAADRIALLLESRAYASVDEIPSYELKTTLQRVIQILKRHRDIHFIDDCTYAPISMIITTLATHAYQGQNAIEDALPTVVARMPNFIKASRPRVENPVNKDEDFADKWSADPRYESNFYLWHGQLTADIHRMLRGDSGYLIQETVEKAFDVRLSEAACGISSDVAVVPAIISSPSPLLLSQGPKPWGR